jgi:hypothetical protein
MSKAKTSALSIVALSALTAIVGGAIDAKAIAEKTNAKLLSVTGALGGLKKNGYIVTNAAGELKATALGRTTVSGPKAPREGSKMEKAMAVVKKLSGKDRSEVLAHLMSEVKLTKAGAATYLSTLSKRLTA